MLHKWLQLASTPAVKAARARYGSVAQYARVDGTADPEGEPRYDRLGPAEQDFIMGRDGFYLASISETGWPYVQYRGGPPGFLRVLDEHTLGYAEFRGNRQYITAGNVAGSDRVSLFLMDYAHQRRLKLFGHLRLTEAEADPALVARLAMPGYEATIERAALIQIEAFDWNCPQHITPRFTEAEIDAALGPVRAEMAALAAENERLRGLLGESDNGDAAGG